MKPKNLLSVILTVSLIFSVLVVTPHLESIHLDTDSPGTLSTPDSSLVVAPSASISGLGASVDISYQVQNKTFTNAYMTDLSPVSARHSISGSYAYMLEDDGAPYWGAAATASNTGTFVFDIWFEVESPYTSLSKMYYDWGFVCQGGDCESYVNELHLFYVGGSTIISGVGEDGFKTGSQALDSSYVNSGKITGLFYISTTDNEAAQDILSLYIDQLIFEYDTVIETRRSEYSVAGGIVRNTISWETWDYNVKTFLTVPPSWTFQNVNPDAAESSDVFTCLIPKTYEAIYDSNVKATANWEEAWNWGFEDDGNEYTKVLDGAVSYNLTSTTYNFTESWDGKAWIVWSSYGLATLDYASGESDTKGTSGEWTTTLTSAASISYLYFSGSNALIDGVAVYTSSVSTGSTITGICRHIHPNGHIPAAYTDVEVGLWDASFDWKTYETVTTDSNGEWSLIAATSGTVLEFDRDNDYVKSDSEFLPINDYTFELWIKINDNTHAAQCLMSSRYGRVQIYFATSYIYWTMHNGTYYSIWTSSLIAAGIWYHVVGVKSSVDGMAIYLNGVEVASNSGADYKKDTQHIDAYLRVGTYETWTEFTNLVNGTISHVRVYDDVLTEAEILSNYKDSDNPLLDNLMAWYKLDEGTGTTANDAANSYDATITGATWATEAYLPPVSFYPDFSAQSYNFWTWVYCDSNGEWDCDAKTEATTDWDCHSGVGETERTSSDAKEGTYSVEGYDFLDVSDTIQFDYNPSSTFDAENTIMTIWLRLNETVSITTLNLALKDSSNRWWYKNIISYYGLVEDTWTQVILPVAKGYDSWIKTANFDASLIDFFRFEAINSTGSNVGYSLKVDSLNFLHAYTSDTLTYPFGSPSDWELSGSFSFGDVYGHLQIASNYDASYNVYENDSSVASGSITKYDDNIRWTLDATVGAHLDVGIEFTHGASTGTKWMNTSYDNSAAVVFDAEGIISYGADWVSITLQLNYDGVDVTAYENDSVVATSSGIDSGHNLGWARETETGIVYVGVKCVYGSETDWINGSYENVVSNAYIRWWIFDQEGNELSLHRFIIYINGTQNYGGEDWVDTSKEYNITVTDRWDTLLNSTTFPYDREVIITITVYTLKVYNADNWMIYFQLYQVGASYEWDEQIGLAHEGVWKLFAADYTFTVTYYDDEGLNGQPDRDNAITISASTGDRYFVSDGTMLREINGMLYDIMYSSNALGSGILFGSPEEKMAIGVIAIIVIGLIVGVLYYRSDAGKSRRRRKNTSSAAVGIMPVN